MGLRSHACTNHLCSYSCSTNDSGLWHPCVDVEFSRRHTKMSPPPLPLPSLTLSPVIHSCDWGWEWRRRIAEKWNREDPGRGLEWSAHHPPQKTLFKFFMAIFTSFNPKTLYISTFSHVAASSTSTPSSPSQSWLSGWHMLAGVGDGSKGDPQVDPPPSLPTHTYTNTHTHPQLQGFAINTNAGEGNGEGGGQGVQWWGG